MAWKAPKATVAALLLTVASAGLAGCIGADQVATSAANASNAFAGQECPSDTSGVQNEAGSFSYGGVVACKSGTETYDWENTASQARVQFGSNIAEGTIEITLTDAADRTVYEGTAEPGNQGRQSTSDTGLPSSPAGSWTVELKFKNVTGNLGLEITSN